EAEEEEEEEEERVHNNHNGQASNKQKVYARCSVEVRKWLSGCYTILHDFDGEVLNKKPKLDVIFHLNHPQDINFDNGGFIQYVEKNKDNNLLTVAPKSNCLSIVFRDGQTLRFVKYLNARHAQAYNDISLI